MPVNSRNPWREFDYGQRKYRLGNQHKFKPILGDTVPQDMKCLMDMLVAIARGDKTSRFREFEKIFRHLAYKLINTATTQESAWMMTEYCNRRMRTTPSKFRFEEPFIEAKRVTVVETNPDGTIAKRPVGRPRKYEIIDGVRVPIVTKQVNRVNQRKLDDVLEEARERIKEESRLEREELLRQELQNIKSGLSTKQQHPLANIITIDIDKL